MSETKRTEEIFNHLKAKGKHLVIDGTTFFVVEGDLLLNETELFAYARQRAALEVAMSAGLKGQRDGLVAITDESGRIVRWRKGMVLTYSVTSTTFADLSQYQMVVQAMRQATAGWESICGVNFRHLKDFDNDSPIGVEQPLFRVAGYNALGEYIAMAFFPYHPPQRRVIYIDPSFFSPDLSFDPVGVLRHELGHVLGFRHEHIRSGAPPVCPDESKNFTFDLTPYDPQSVMHYFCGGVGTRELEFTELDRQGAPLVYGPPDKAVTYYDSTDPSTTG